MMDMSSGWVKKQYIFICSHCNAFISLHTPSKRVTIALAYISLLAEREFTIPHTFIITFTNQARPERWKMCQFKIPL